MLWSSQLAWEIGIVTLQGSKPWSCFIFPCQFCIPFDISACRSRTLMAFFCLSSVWLPETPSCGLCVYVCSKSVPDICSIVISMVCLAGCTRVGRLHLAAWWNYSTVERSSFSGQSWLDQYWTLQWGWLGDTGEPCWFGWRNNLEAGVLCFLFFFSICLLFLPSVVIPTRYIFFKWSINLIIIILKSGWHRLWGHEIPIVVGWT